MHETQPRAKRNVIRTAAFVLFLAGLMLAFASGGMVWKTEPNLQWIGFGLSFVLLILDGFVFRRRTEHAFTWTHLAGAALVLLSLVYFIFSPNKYDAVHRTLVWVGCGLMLIVLPDWFRHGMERGTVVTALMWATGIVMMMAVLETWFAYQSWWTLAGSTSVFPPYAYRLVSILGHPNTYMSLVNLVAPFAGVAFFTSRTRLGRLGFGVWLAFFLISAPFTSSRGGWLGLLAGCFSLLLLWLIQNGGWGRLTAAVKKMPHVAGWAAGGLALIAVGALIWLGRYFAVHPSHGGNPFASRIDIWRNAFRIWQQSPWFGAGSGQFPYAYLGVEYGHPRAFWAHHAHSLPIQLLAEYGVIGFVLFTAVAVLIGIGMYRSLRASPSSERLWLAALLAGVVAWLAQMTFDDETAVSSVMIPLMVVIAMITSKEPNLAGVIKQKSFFPALPIGLILILIWGWNLTQTLPLYTANQLWHEGEVESASELLQQVSIAQPYAVYPSIQAGMALAEVWQVDGDVVKLNAARRDLMSAVDLFPQVTWVWADLGVLDAQAGDLDAAIDHLEEAVRRSPNEPGYKVNLGWVYEQAGLAEKAGSMYLAALDQEPSWASHPFWGQTDLRTGIALHYRQTPVSLPGFCAKADQAIQAGRLDEARLLLATADWVGEPVEAVLVVRHRLAITRGDLAGAEEIALDLGKSAARIRTSWSDGLANSFSVWLYGQPITGSVLVPGYIALTPDYGQFEIIENLYADYHASGKCETAGLVWTWMDTANNGRELIPPSAATACP